MRMNMRRRTLALGAAMGRALCCVAAGAWSVWPRGPRTLG